MVTVKVGGEERDSANVDQHWLCNQVNGRRHEGGQTCVIVRVKTDALDMVLSTPGCGGAPGGRAPTRDEAKIFDLWNQLHLNQPGFSCGNVHAFLVQLRRLL
jgi:hypothetical protein